MQGAWIFRCYISMKFHNVLPFWYEGTASYGIYTWWTSILHCMPGETQIFLILLRDELMKMLVDSAPAPVFNFVNANVRALIQTGVANFGLMITLHCVSSSNLQGRESVLSRFDMLIQRACLEANIISWWLEVEDHNYSWSQKCSKIFF